MRVLLHICCGVCASPCVERLKEEGYEVSGYFYNPNIQPLEEYLKRLEEVKRLSEEQNFPLLIGKYDLEGWSAQIAGLEGEPEGGKRCARCFRFRLEATAELAQNAKFSAITTTLTVGPHKNVQLINEIGESIGNGLFLPRDFKKQDGFKRAQELARQYNLYRQNYCGCIYSLKERQKYEQLHKEARTSRD